MLAVDGGAAEGHDGPPVTCDRPGADHSGDAGAFPAEWRARLVRHDDIVALADRLYEVATANTQ